MNRQNTSWEIGTLRLSPRLVVEMALTSLRIRLGRTFLTVLTITTCTAFLIHLLTMQREESRDEVEGWMLMLALSLLVSVAGVLNTMLMSVTQRYREIGTMKCLGALDSFVLLAVLVESAMVGFVGAMGGIVCGLLISLTLALADFGPAFMEAVRLDGLGIKVLITAAVGMTLTTLGALIPALIAAKMPPVEAMRGEK